MKTKNTLSIALVAATLNLLSASASAEPELLDASCKAETKKATEDIALENKTDNGAANRAAIAKQQAGIQACLQKSLSQTCYQQLKSKSYSSVDPACKKQFEQALPCSQSAIGDSQKRFLSHLSPSCQEQVKTMHERLRKRAKVCTDLTEQLCGKIGATNDFGKCYKEHQSEISKACPK